MNLRIVIMIFVVVCLVLSVGIVVAEDLAGPGKDEQEAFKKVRTIIINVEEHYTDEYGTKLTQPSYLPALQRVASEMLEACGMRVVSGKDAHDAVLSIAVKGSASGASYSDGKTHYTGAYIEGSFSFEFGGMKYAQRFEGSRSTSGISSAGIDLSPRDAPFTAVLYAAFMPRFSESLAALCQVSKARPLLGSLKDRESCVRSESVELLGKAHDRSVTPVLLKALDDHEISGVWEALVELRDPRITPRLIKELKTSEWETMRSFAAESLGVMGDVQAVPVLIQALQDKSTYWVRPAAVTALGKLKDGRAVGPLLVMLQDPVCNFRGKVVAALGSIADRKSVNPLVSLLENRSPALRAAVAEALGQIGDSAALPALTRCAESDTDATVREKAGRAVNKLKQQHLKN